MARDRRRPGNHRRAPCRAGYAAWPGRLGCLRQPIALILLLIALFTTVSGKPLDGFLMLTVAMRLVWDAARGGGHRALRDRDPSPPGRQRPAAAPHLTADSCAHPTISAHRPAARLLRALLDPHRFPELTAVARSGVMDKADPWAENFEFGLDRILDGVDVLVRGAASQD